MKKIEAKPLEEHLQELSGTPTSKVEKLVSITYIYNSPATLNNVNKFLRTEEDPDFEVYNEEDDNGKAVPHGTVFYWETPIFARTKTIGQFISVATALDRKLYWNEEVYQEYLHINIKY